MLSREFKRIVLVPMRKRNRVKIAAATVLEVGPVPHEHPALIVALFAVLDNSQVVLDVLMENFAEAQAIDKVSRALTAQLGIERCRW